MEHVDRQDSATELNGDVSELVHRAGPGREGRERTPAANLRG